MSAGLRKPTPLQVFESIFLVVLRLGLGGLLVYAVITKNLDARNMADAIKAYDLFDAGTNGHAIVTLAYTVLWIELLCGIFLILATWCRGAGLLAAVLMLGFGAANYFVFKNAAEPVKCPCFGDTHPFCGADPIGMCHVWTNVGMAAVGLLLAWRGGGLWGVDRVLGSRFANDRALVGPDGEHDVDADD